MYLEKRVSCYSFNNLAKRQNIEISENGNINIKIKLYESKKIVFVNELLDIIDVIIIKKVRHFIEKSGQKYIKCVDIFSAKKTI